MTGSIHEDQREEREYRPLGDIPNSTAAVLVFFAYIGGLATLIWLFSLIRNFLKS